MQLLFCLYALQQIRSHVAKNWFKTQSYHSQKVTLQARDLSDKSKVCISLFSEKQKSCVAMSVFRLFKLIRKTTSHLCHSIIQRLVISTIQWEILRLTCDCLQGTLDCFTSTRLFLHHSAPPTKLDFSLINQEQVKNYWPRRWKPFVFVGCSNKSYYSNCLKHSDGKQLNKTSFT